jgi:polysaccharide deacetylase 2 family uncharacterized protein YibQ
VIANAGGSQVWIKSRLHRGKNADAPLEVLVTSGAYDSIEAALRREAAQRKLDFARLLGGGAAQAADIEISRRGQGILRVHLRQVPRLLRASIVIDDLGSDLEAPRKLLAFSYPLTYSILPHLTCSSTAAQELHHAGAEVMLHLPMDPEPGSHASAGQSALRPGMGETEARQIIDRDLASVPFVQGVNNHMGSRATKNAPLMAEVMKVLADRKLYFIDSRTTAETVALDAARRQGVPSFYRSVFLDDEQSVPYTLGQLRRFCRVVEEQGAALAIGHPHPTTLAALERFLPEFERCDIELVPASRLVHLPEVAHLSPPGSTKQ